MKKRIYLFDFDKTLTDEDSIFLLWKYAFKKKKCHFLSFAMRMVRGSFKYIIHGFNFTMIKNEMVSVIGYFSDDELRAFVRYVYNEHILKDGVEFFNSIDNSSYKMLVSASPINYLKYLDEFFDFDCIIGTDLNDDLTLSGKNNRSYEKVRRIRNHLREVNIEIDYDSSCAFSDSYKADRPMLEMVKNRYLINSDLKIDGYNNFHWI